MKGLLRSVGILKPDRLADLAGTSRQHPWTWSSVLLVSRVGVLVVQ